MATNTMRSTCYRVKQHAVIICCIVLGCSKDILSFSYPTFIRPSLSIQQRSATSSSLQMLDALFSEPVKTAVATKPEEIFDKNGKKFTVGSIVRVSVDGLKQFQISPKALGAFDDNKKFVQDTSDDKTIKKYFALPIGLRGIVTKVYNLDVVSANYPIQVKFESGKYVDEGYDPPAMFLMHFQPDEVAVV